MNPARLLKHLVMPDWVAKRPFPPEVLSRIEASVRESEKTHSGELRIAIEGSLDPLAVARRQSPRQRALEVFAFLRVWDTEQNSGVLVYLQMVDRRIEIVADRGIARRVDQATWDAICRRMEDAFRLGNFELGLKDAIGEITALLAMHFPPGADNPDELPDRPVLL